MNKVILDDFISEFKKGYNKETFNSLEVVNNDLLDQSSIFIKQNKPAEDEMKRIYSISPMNTTSVNVILNEASKQLPFDGYYLRERSGKAMTNYVQFTK